MFSRLCQDLIPCSPLCPVNTQKHPELLFGTRCFINIPAGFTRRLKLAAGAGPGSMDAELRFCCAVSERQSWSKIFQPGSGLREISARNCPGWGISAGAGAALPQVKYSPLQGICSAFQIPFGVKNAGGSCLICPQLQTLLFLHANKAWLCTFAFTRGAAPSL